MRVPTGLAVGSTPMARGRDRGTRSLAHECDFDLATFPAIRAWLDRVAAEPGYVQALELLAIGTMVEHEVVGPDLVRPRGRLRARPRSRNPRNLTPKTAPTQNPCIMASSTVGAASEAESCPETTRSTVPQYPSIS